MILTPTQLRTLAWLGLAVLLALLLWLLAPVLTPFVVAAVLAYALHPVVEKMAARRLPRWLGAALALSALMCVALGVLLLIVPVISKQVPLIRDQVPLLLERVNAVLAPWAARVGLDVAVDVEQVRAWLRGLVSGHEEELLQGLMASLRIGGSAFAAVLGNLVLTPLVAYYLLLDWAALVQRFKALVPVRWRESTEGFLQETDEVLGQYLHGQLMVMGVLALFYTVALALVGLKLALPIGVFTGLAVFVPYLGFGLGLILAVLAALLQFQSITGLLAVAAVYGLGQVIESLFLTPRLLGQRIGLHPIAVIFALMAFGHLLGFVGVLIALPLSAVLLVALRRVHARYLSSDLYRGDGN